MVPIPYGNNAKSADLAGGTHKECKR
ncbi:hypothetical protein ACP52Y_001038 [Vibrio vulnificus]|nr:hypothetical protein [Vibrio vulnificus]MCU8183359.1 hypothetical protein [Vibrio vulnificus]MCU8551223.1 hypothetical protein [Vibrio vulnificus]